jgi:hypothetical protein
MSAGVQTNGVHAPRSGKRHRDRCSRRLQQTLDQLQLWVVPPRNDFAQVQSQPARRPKDKAFSPLSSYQPPVRTVIHLKPLRHLHSGGLEPA